MEDSQGMPLANTTVAGENIALVISTVNSWEGDLSVWNWRTGVKKGEVHIPEPRLGLLFLQEDLLLNGNLISMSLDAYRISENTSTSSQGLEMQSNEIGANCICLIQSFCLPEIDVDEYETTHITVRAKPSLPLVSLQSTALPFTSDLKSALLLVEVDIRKADYGSEPSRVFTFITHRQTILDMALQAMDSPIQYSSDVKGIPWHLWGPKSTRMITGASMMYGGAGASAGTRCISLQQDCLEALDFGRYKASRGAVGRLENKPDVNNVEVQWVGTESIFPISTGPFTQEVRTSLPYVRTRRSQGFKSEPWDGVFVDDERIVGFTTGSFHIFHL